MMIKFDIKILIKHKMQVLKAITELNLPFRLKVDIPYFDEMLDTSLMPYKNITVAEYYANKGRFALPYIVNPLFYIEYCAEGFTENTGEEYTIEDLLDSRNDEYVDKYMKMMQNGVKFDMPYIEWDGDYFSQEGIHRAIAAYRLGYKYMPMLEAFRE